MVACRRGAELATGVDLRVMRALRANLKSRRDDAKLAQGVRGTSAALGCEPKMIICSFRGGALPGCQAGSLKRHKT